MLYHIPSRKHSREALMTSAVRGTLALALAALWLACGLGAFSASAQVIPPPAGFRNFEGPQVHPLALTPDGKRLLAVNTPNATLSIFQLSSGTPVLTAEIPVGLEPVSVAARNDREAWVVNWLSDSVSIVDLSTGNVVRTINVGDEPTDVLFAGTTREMAFVCVSGTRSVAALDAANPSLHGQFIQVFGKQPRALARSADGARVFVSVFESGNQTTIVPEQLVSANGGLPPPNPSMKQGLPVAPKTGLIVKWDGSNWIDELSRSWNFAIPYTLADVDLVMIDASSSSPSVLAQARGVGTHVGNMAFDPSTGRLLVANLDSTNQVRFEPNLSGRFQQSRVSLVEVQPDALSILSTQDLNPHVNLSGAGPDAERSQSLAMPGDVVRASDGAVYVAATSSARIGVLNSVGALQSRIAVGSGPTGLALDEGRQRLYVLNRFDGTLGVVDTGSKSQVAQVSLGFNPEPAAVRAGRKILFDAGLSRHGTVSCASCHLNGHRDGLAWDLGDPQGSVDTVNGGGFVSNFHPMKGPMTTQSLRGITGTEPLHWRGDRAALTSFNPAFVSLLGGTRQLNVQEMSDFGAFVRSLTYPPNPNEKLNRKPSDFGAAGFNDFNTRRLDASTLTCIQCHALTVFSTPGGGGTITGTGTNSIIIPGILLQETQDFKVPQLRGLYQKMGMSRTAGEQLSGFGFIHDGTNDSIFDFLKTAVFTFPDSDPILADAMRRDIEKFLLELDTGTAPAVGTQVTLNAENSINKHPEAFPASFSALRDQAAAGNCDLVVHGIYGGAPRSFLRLADGTYQPDSLSEAPVTQTALLNAVDAGAELTFMGVVPGTGRRMSIDRDSNGVLNDDEPRTTVSITGRVVDATGQGLAGVAVTLSGTQAGAAVTDSAGSYTFNYVSTTGTHTVAPQAAGVSFSPASRTFSNPSWNQSATFVTSPTANASDSSRFFVAQHYNDFLNREPDASGLQFWTNEIEGCGANQVCREVKRNNVSAAFFLSIEFKETGYLVYRVYKSSFGDLAGRPAPVTFQQLMTDTQRVGRNVVVGPAGWEQQLETNKQAFFLGWVQRPEFLARYPTTMSTTDFVNTLNSNTGFSLSVAERDALASQLSSNNTTQGRALVVRQVAENAEFTRRELNRAFVLMQYFGYLRRNPNDAPDSDFVGYSFWLSKLEQFQGNYINAEMVKAFITSLEYRNRFGQP
jgi:YVTN family beta-propeller protein